MRIRSKLFSILIIMVAIPVSLITIFNYINAKNAIQNEVMTNLSLVAEGLEGAILEFLANKKQIATGFAYDSYIREKVVQMGSIEDLESRKKTANSLRRYLSLKIKAVDPDINMIHILNLEGKEIAGTDKDHLWNDKDKAESYFLRGLEQPYIQTPLFHEHHKEKHYFLPFAAPVKNPKDSRTIAVLMIGYPVQVIKDILTGKRTHELGSDSTLADHATNTNIMLVNHDGTYLIPPKGHEDIHSSELKIATRPVTECLEKGKKINDEWKDPEGHLVWGVSMCLKPEHEWKWVLIVKKYKADALAPIVRFRNLSIMIGMLSLLIVAVTAFSTSRAIAKPIQTLKEGTEIIGKGNLDYKVGTSVNDEIGHLSRAFDEMTENLKQVMASKNELNREIRERKAAEQKIIQGKKDLEIILDSLPFGVVIIGRDRKIRSINNVALSLTGHESPEHVIAKSCTSVMCPSEIGKCPILDLQEKLDRSERILLTKDGRRTPILKSAVPITLNDEEVLLEAFIDITDRKNAEEKIFALNRIYSVMSEINQMIVRVRDREKMYTEACRIAVEHGMFIMSWIGITNMDTLLVKPVAHWGDNNGYLDEMQVSVSDDPVKRGPVGSTIRERKPFICNNIELDERMIPWRYAALSRGYRSVSAFPLQTETRLIGAISFYSEEVDFFDDEEIRLLSDLAVDISFALEFMEKEELRKKSEQFINNIFESMGEGLIVIDRNLRIISANTAYCRQANVSCGEILGRHCYEISHHFDKPCNEAGEECPASKTFETGMPQNVIHTHYDKEGRPVYVDIRTYPMKNESGDIESIIEVTSDITERVKLEEQLRHAQKMEAIGTLAGGIAHDFNNIITAIIGFGSLIDMNLARDNVLRTHLNEIFLATERATSLTRSLLSFSRKQVINLKPVNLNEIVKQVSKFLSRLIGADISLKTAFADEDIVVKADSGQIEQVLMNLTTNARDAMPKGGLLSIQTETAKLDEDFIKAHGYGTPGEYALISVTDTGEGFDESIQKKIFEPFFTTKETGKGTGLGLAIVYGIIKQHNGYINCYSEKGIGTTFKIYLPLAKQDLKEKQESVIQTETLPAGGTETILIAEDDDSLRKLLRTVLTQSGYKTVEAVNGIDAVNKFIDNKEKINLIILDFIMPKKNGKEAYDQIKKIRPDIKCIIMSGYTPDILRKEELSDRGLDFISKPVSPIKLLKQIREVLNT